MLPAVAVEGLPLPPLADQLTPTLCRRLALPEELVQAQQRVAVISPAGGHASCAGPSRQRSANRDTLHPSSSLVLSGLVCRANYVFVV